MITEKMLCMLSRMVLAKGAGIDALDKLKTSFDFPFPIDFEEFLLFSNGAKGELGSEFIELWSVEEILELNEVMEVQMNAPGLIAFGSDGANELYAFDTRVVPPLVVQIPMIGMGLEVVWHCSDTFENLLASKSG